MTSTQESIATALERHRAGDLDRAGNLYRQILARHPHHADALHLLGLVSSEAGDQDAAIASITKAIQIRGEVPVYYSNLGLALMRRGRLDEAILTLHRALAFSPRDAGICAMLGRALHARGRSEAAAVALRQAITWKPEFAEAHNDLGNILMALDRPGEAIKAYGEAIGLDEDFAEAHNNLANALHSSGETGLAVVSYRRAVSLDPSYMEAWLNLANALQKTGHLSEAVSAYRGALRLDPCSSTAAFELGNALHSIGSWEEAADCYRQALVSQPGESRIWYNLGITRTMQNRLEEAVDAFREALRIQPRYVEALNNLGNVHLAQGRVADAAAHYRGALAADPDYLDARYNLGIVLQKQERLEEALSCYSEVLTRKPAYPEAHNNYGNTALALGRPLEARASYREAVKWQHPEAHWNLGLVQLLLGEYEEGWKGYEWRFRQPGSTPRKFEAPLWKGEPLTGPAGEPLPILLYAEQGLGDTLQFVRYAPLVTGLGGRVIVECQPALAPLLGGCAGIEVFARDESPLPEFAYRAPLLSVPGVLGTTISTIPAVVPYIETPAAKREEWKQKIAAYVTAHRGEEERPGRKIGLAWAGNPMHKNDGNRSLSLRRMAAMAKIPRALFFALQKGPQAVETLDPPPGMRIVSLEKELAGFTDTAAAILNLDLIVSVDTSVAHLAGAVSAPVWTLLPFMPDWRWMLDRADSPWYPSMRLFRQPKAGDWESVIDEVVRALEAESPLPE